MGVDDPYVAYCLDQAVGHFGRTLQGELDSVDAKDAADGEYKRRRILEKYLGEEDKPSRGMFADPATMFT